MAGVNRRGRPDTNLRANSIGRRLVGILSSDYFVEMTEIFLSGGRMTDGVVRVGQTVRRPSGPNSEFVRKLLQHLETAGFIIEDHKIEWKAGDTLCIPVFSWHQHFNTGTEPARFLVHHNRPFMENLGHMLVQQGESASGLDRPAIQAGDAVFPMLEKLKVDPEQIRRRNEDGTRPGKE